jgi:hypothetical protein
VLQTLGWGAAAGWLILTMYSVSSSAWTPSRAGGARRHGVLVTLVLDPEVQTGCPGHPRLNPGAVMAEKRQEPMPRDFMGLVSEIHAPRFWVAVRVAER